MARGDAGGSCFWYRRKITNLSEAPANVETTFFLPVSEDRDTLDLKTIEANRRLQDEITDKVTFVFLWFASQIHLFIHSVFFENEVCVIMYDLCNFLFE